MKSNQKKKFVNIFTGGMNTDLAPEYMPPDKYEYMLNCNVTSSAAGQEGKVANMKGNVEIPVELPAGENKTIGVVLDEEKKRFYFAVWNSNGRHTWYLFDGVSTTVSIVMQCITDTGNVDIFNWNKTDVLLHGNVISNKLLYWAMPGHPARKINIEKAIAKDDNGYGTVILEEYTRAYKKTADFPPTAKYFTDPNVKSNHVYGNLYQFCQLFIYDDGENSVCSDFSIIAIPDKENVTGTTGVPLENNAIAVSMLTGGMIVKKIKLLMRKCNVDGGVTPWVSIVVLDKKILGIKDNSEYTYNFYNDNTYIAEDPNMVLLPYSFLPRNPETQEYLNNAITYFNFEEGFEPVSVDITSQVIYEDLFVDDGAEDKLNEPSIVINHIDEWYESGGFLSKGWRHTTDEVVIGPDVKRGNIFTVRIMDGSTVDSEYSYEAGLSDTANTVANALANKFRTHARMSGKVGDKQGWVDKVEGSGSSAKFRFDIWNRAGRGYHTFQTFVNPVYYSTLKNTGNSVLTNKLGSGRRYGIVYSDQDQVKTLTFGNIEAVYIKNLNELQGLKKATVALNIRHKAPSWAKNFEIVCTKNLVHDSFIQVLIQSAAKITTNLGESYTDISIGSFNTYKRIHQNSTLTYEFKKGDRLRLLKNYDDGPKTWTIPADVIDYEIIGYFPEVKDTINKNVKVNGTNTVVVDNPDQNHRGSNIVIEGVERTIVNVTGTGYELDANITFDGTTTDKTYPTFQIINRRGVIRIKENASYPIDVNGSTKFALVEIYSPSQTFSNADQENYYSTGLKFPVVEENGLFLHYGNQRNQTANIPAIVYIYGFDNYVRNRELPTNNVIENYQAVITSVEDQSFSDFYVSNLSSLGRPSRLDDATGVVKFDSRGRFSENFIEDTKINGLNMFYNLNRVDYNDKYGPIVRLLFHEGRLYIFKHLKYCWVPVNGSIISDADGNETLVTSSHLLPNQISYFLWESGVGDNPESVVRYGNEIFSVSPNAGMIMRLGGNGNLPASKQFGIDRRAREIISNASKSSAKMFGAYDRKNSKYILNVEGYEQIVFNMPISSSTYEVEPVFPLGVFEIVTQPTNGSLVISSGNIRYVPDQNYSGPDSFVYKYSNGVARTVALNVLSSETAFDWRPTGQYCVAESGTRTGFKAYTTLEEYDVISGNPTGVTKPNVDTDPDYVAPIEDLNACPIGDEYVYVAIINRRINSQSIVFDITSVDNFNIQLKENNDFSSATIVETGMVSSGQYTLNLSLAPSDAHLFISVENAGNAGVTKFSMKNAYLSQIYLYLFTELEEIVLDQSSIPDSHNNQFTSLNIGYKVKKLKVIKHELGAFGTSFNDVLEDVDLSYGRNLSLIDFSNWAVIKKLKINNCLFTSSGQYTTAIDEIIAKMYSESLAPVSLQYGSDNLTGIKPSESVYPVYRALVNNGVIITGKAPDTVTSSNLNMPQYGSMFDEVFYDLFLSNMLAVDLSVRVVGTYTDIDNVVHPIDEVSVIPKATYGRRFYLYPTEPVIDILLNINSVTPNPAGGITINF